MSVGVGVVGVGARGCVAGAGAGRGALAELGGGGGGGGGEQLQADPDVSRKIHTRVLGPGTLNRRDRHFQRVLQQYCAHKQKCVCSILPRPKRGARAW